MSALTDLQAAVAAESAEIQAVLAYLQGLPALLSSAQGASDADLATLTAQVQSETATLAAGLAAAPAEPAPTPAPTA